MASESWSNFKVTIRDPRTRNDPALGDTAWPDQRPGSYNGNSYWHPVWQMWIELPDDIDPDAWLTRPIFTMNDFGMTGGCPANGKEHIVLAGYDDSYRKIYFGTA